MKILRRFYLLVFGITGAALAFAGECHAADELNGDAYVKEWSDKCDDLVAQWKTHPATLDDDLADKLIEAAVKSDRTEVADMVAGKHMDISSIEIKSSVKISVIHAKILHNLGKPPVDEYGDGVMDCVFRRMTRDRFEAWTPKRGWLFDGDGTLINEARPPRRDGTGREWYGAFLPDGSWATTDLWEYDRTLTFFSRKGKWVKEIPSEVLAPPKEHEGTGHDLIGWARCDRDGKGWVVSVGSEGRRAVVFVKPHGKAQLLTGQDAPWKLCYPRDLEPKGMFTVLFRPSDDFDDLITFTEPAHGTWVGYPHYQTNSGKIITVIANGNHNFGYLPGAHDVFICADEPQSGDTKSLERTWFFKANGACRGWMQGSYLADASNGKGIWLLDNENCVMALDATLKPQSHTRFLIEGKQAAPMKLFTDLRLGFFSLDGEVLLANW